jgi:hypothetical protein
VGDDNHFFHGWQLNLGLSVRCHFDSSRMLGRRRRRRRLF